MEIKCSVEELRKKSIFVAMPCYGGFMIGMTAKSLLDLQGLCGHYGIPCRFSFLFNESLITRARNYLCDEFLHRSDCTHMLFIDSDVVLNPQDVIAMLALDKEIIGIGYPKKSINWGNIKKAVVKNPNIDENELPKLMGQVVFNPVGGTKSFNVTEPIEVLEVGTGAMMINREVFKKFDEAYPQKKYKPDHVGTDWFDGSREIMAYFDCYIDDVSKRYLSEDYAFNQLCRKIGIKTWLMPWCETQHIGTFNFMNSLPAIAHHLGEL